MSFSVFVSHVYEDNAARARLDAWAQAGRLGADVVITGESEDVRVHGASAIRAHLNPKVQGASAVLVLLGDDTHNHAWVEHEVQYARSVRKLVVPVRLPGTRGALPHNLRDLTPVTFEPEAIRRALGR